MAEGGIPVIPDNFHESADSAELVSRTEKKIVSDMLGEKVGEFDSLWPDWRCRKLTVSELNEILEAMECPHIIYTLKGYRMGRSQRCICWFGAGLDPVVVGTWDNRGNNLGRVVINLEHGERSLQPCEGADQDSEAVERKSSPSTKCSANPAELGTKMENEQKLVQPSDQPALLAGYTDAPSLGSTSLFSDGCGVSGEVRALQQPKQVGHAAQMSTVMQTNSKVPQSTYRSTVAHAPDAVDEQLDKFKSSQSYCVKGLKRKLAEVTKRKEATEAELNRLQDEINHLRERDNLNHSMLSTLGQRLRAFTRNQRELRQYDQLRDSHNELVDRLRDANETIEEQQQMLRQLLAERNPPARLVLLGRNRPPEQVNGEDLGYDSSGDGGGLQDSGDDQEEP